MTTAIRDVAAAVDADENSATVSVTVEHELEIDGLFDQRGRLRLWEDASGWSGLLREVDGFYRVNYSAQRGEFIEKKPLSLDEVRVALARHVRDPEAGGVGRFERGCSPP